MKIKVSFIFLLSCLLTQTSNAQNDDTLIYSQEVFLQAVFKNHPVASQARLLSEVALQEIRFAKGLLDPALKGGFEEKNFSGSNYYTTFGTALELPFWIGDVKAGFDQNSGPRLATDRFTVNQGVTYLGLSVPILQGLIIDERRTAILQAKAFQTIAEGEQIKLINKLLLSAAKDYWEWAFAYERFRLLSEALDLSLFRFNAIKERAFQGDAAYIDTLEAFLQVQNFDISSQQAKVDFTNMGLILSTYLWDEDGNAIQLSSNTFPTWVNAEDLLPNEESVDELKRFAEINHPEIRKIVGKLGQLDVERKMAVEKFKPRFDVNYSYLWGGLGLPPSPELSNDNWDRSAKFGFDYKVPIIFRSERAKWKLAKLKIRDTNLQRQQLNRDIQNQIDNTYNELITQNRLKIIQNEIVRNNEALRNAELRKFENGESSLFLINTREVTLVNSRIKLYEILSKYAKNLVMLRWAAGNMTD